VRNILKTEMGLWPISFVAASLIYLPGALAQSTGTASISGHVLSEQGLTLRASVTLSFASARGYPAPPRRVLTGANGAFTFSKLPAGKYVLCAQVAASEPAPANSPYVDACVWPSGQTPITLAAGQQIAGVVFTAPKGTWLQIRVADPDHVLPQASAKGPALLEPELQLVLKGPDGLYRHARFLSSDSGGRNYQMAIPLKTALGLKIASSVANVFDQAGSQVKNGDEHGIQPATPADLTPLTYTLHKSGH
jgi:hypothetical protein